MRYFDNTILSDFKTCMRFGYFKHVRGWQSDRKNPKLIFGSAWHAAMDVVWQHLASPDRTESTAAVVDAAAEAFGRAWEEEGGPIFLSPLSLRDWAPHIPQTARLMLESYVEQHSRTLRYLRLVRAEELFCVMILPGVGYVGRRDKLVQHGSTGRHVIVEHKTTGWGTKNGFKDAWENTWTNKSQIDGYLYTAGLAYPNLSLSVWVDAALVHATVHDKFRFIPVIRTAEHLDAWLWETKYWISDILRHEAAAGDAAAAQFMAAFPKNTGACIQYFKKCAYYDVCTQHANPARVEKPPIGMVERFWLPATEEELKELT